MTKETGGSAFPCLPPQDTAAGVATGYPYPDAGMTLRDYFAAKALQVVPEQSPYNMEPHESFEHYTARRAYAIADAMLRRRALP